MITEKLLRFLHEDYRRTGRRARCIYIPPIEWAFLQREVHSTILGGRASERGVHYLYLQMGYGQVKIMEEGNESNINI